MSQSLGRTQDDIAYVKSLALQGRGAILCGWSLIAAGAIFSLASLVGWGIEAKVIPLPSLWQAYAQLAALLLFFVAAVMLNARLVRRIASGEIAVGSLSRCVGAAWQSVACGLFTLILALSLYAWHTLDLGAFALITPIVFALYGMAWLVSATAAGVRWMRWAAYGCFLVALALGYTGASAASYPIAIAGLLLFALVPGLLLVRDPAPTER